MGFTKLDSGILQSSIMAEPPETFKVFIAILASCGPDGIAKVSSTYLAAACYFPLEVVDTALAVLEAPDPRSRSLADDGRRIRRVDGGYKVINYKKYRYYAYEFGPAENKRRAVWRHENENAPGYIYFMRAGDRIKVGFSRNPWARLSEIKTGNPDAILIGTMAGSLLEEAEIHRKFKRFHIGREWFAADNELLDEIFLLLKEKGGRVTDPATNNPASVGSVVPTISSISRGRLLHRSSVASASASSSASSLITKGKKPNPDDLRLVQLLIDLMQENNPGSLTLKKLSASGQGEWLNQCRLLRERDGKSPAEIETVIRFSQSDEFWRSNILSMGKLRKHWDKLFIKSMKADPLRGIREWLDDTKEK